VVVAVLEAFLVVLAAQAAAVLVMVELIVFQELRELLILVVALVEVGKLMLMVVQA
jgi:hypothetical protein